MANHKPLLMDPDAAGRKIKGLDPDKIDEFLKLVRRTRMKKPVPADVRELRRWLAEYPELLCRVFDLAEFTRSALIERMMSGDATRAALEANVASIKQDFGYEKAPAIEKLLIDNILVAWLRVQCLENQLSSLMGTNISSIPIVEFLERRLSVSQRRYLAACQALAKIRELSARNPSLQLNIATQGGQQVNVVGVLPNKD